MDINNQNPQSPEGVTAPEVQGTEQPASSEVGDGSQGQAGQPAVGSQIQQAVDLALAGLKTELNQSMSALRTQVGRAISGNTLLRNAKESPQHQQPATPAESPLDGFEGSNDLRKGIEQAVEVKLQQFIDQANQAQAQSNFNKNVINSAVPNLKDLLPEMEKLMNQDGHDLVEISEIIANPYSANPVAIIQYANKAAAILGKEKSLTTPDKIAKNINNSVKNTAPVSGGVQTASPASLAQKLSQMTQQDAAVAISQLSDEQAALLDKELAALGHTV